MAEKRHCAATRSRVAAPSASVNSSTASSRSANSRVKAPFWVSACRSSSFLDLLSASNSRAWSRSISVSVAVFAAVSARAFCVASARRHRPSDIDARAAAAAAFSFRIAARSSRSRADTASSLDAGFVVSSPKNENDSLDKGSGTGSFAALRLRSPGTAATNAGESGCESASFENGEGPPSLAAASRGRVVRIVGGGARVAADGRPSIRAFVRVSEFS